MNKKPSNYLTLKETSGYLKANRADFKIVSNGVVFDALRWKQQTYLLIFEKFRAKNFEKYAHSYSTKINGEIVQAFYKPDVDKMIAEHVDEIKEIATNLMKK